jgi:hypothetical protein
MGPDRSSCFHSEVDKAFYSYNQLLYDNVGEANGGKSAASIKSCDTRNI